MSDYYLGEIRLFAGNYAPEDWAQCNGQLLTIQGNEALFSLIGNAWGGDGRVNFALPDLRGRIAVGQGTGVGLTPRTVGQTGGSETVTLTMAQIPPHTHSANISTGNATASTPGPTVIRSGLPSPYVGFLPNTAQSGDLLPLDASMVGSTGGNQPHANVMPFLALTYIIALRGTYPTKP